MPALGGLRRDRTRRQPVAPQLERIGRQRHDVTGKAVIDRAQVGLDAVQEQGGQTGQHALPGAAAVIEAAQPEDFAAGAGPACRRLAVARPDLDDHVAVFVRQPRLRAFIEAAVAHLTQRVVEADGALDAAGGAAPDADAQCQIRLDAPGPPQLGERDIQRKGRNPGQVGIAAPCRVAAEDATYERVPVRRARPAPPRGRWRRGTPPGSRRGRRRCRRRGENLAAAQERDPRARGGDLRAEPEGAQRLACRVVRPYHPGGTMRLERPSGEGEADIRDRRRRRSAEPCRQIRGEASQRLGGFRRDCQQMRGTLMRGLGRRRLRSLLEHRMRVGSADAECTDPGEAAAGARPGQVFGDRAHVQAIPGDLRVRRAQVRRRGISPCCSTSARLDQAGDARGRFEVADIGLDRSDRQRRSAVATGAEHRAERADLDRIAERRAGAVRLDIADRAGATPARSSAARITACWAGPFGTVSPLLRPSWLTAVPRITAQIAVAGRHRVGQPLQHDHAAALAAHVAVGRGVERLAAAVGDSIRARHAATIPAGVRIRLTPAAIAASHSPIAQAPAGQVHGDQRGRARGVDRRGSAPADRARTTGGRRRHSATCR